MRRAVLILAVVAVVSVVLSGLALAVTKSGGDGDNRIEGTRQSDRLSGGAGDDRIFGKDGNDNLFGDPGNDRLFAQGGDNDFINAIDEHRDPVIDCGAGENDEAYLDGRDDFLAAQETCENVVLIEIQPVRAAGIDPKTLTPGTLTPGTLTPEVRAAITRVE